MQKDKFEFFDWLKTIFRFCNCAVCKTTELPPVNKKTELSSVAKKKETKKFEKSTQTPHGAEGFIFVEKAKKSQK